MSAAERTFVERTFLHDRAALAATLIVLPLACWAWIVPMARDMSGAMTGPSAWMMTTVWDTPHVLLLLAMWIAMMAGMMLPSAAPVLLLYAGSVRHRAGARAAARAVYAMTAGYLTVWLLFSVGATALQRALASLLLLSPMMTLTSTRLAGALLIGAGVYQLTPLKSRCLAWCSAPVDFLTRRWRRDTGGFRLGLEHGVVCVGCCWALMLLLFVGGVMNVAVIGVLTAVVLLEKLARLGRRWVRLSGAALIALGIAAFFFGGTDVHRLTQGSITNRESLIADPGSLINIPNPVSRIPYPDPESRIPNRPIPNRIGLVSNWPRAAASLLPRYARYPS